MVPGEKENGSLRHQIQHYEKQLIKSCLQDANWQKGIAASSLGINRKTLYHKIHKYGITKC
jgi:DNA-binding NtrC family response regulator